MKFLRSRLARIVSLIFAAVPPLVAFSNVLLTMPARAALEESSESVGSCFVGVDFPALSFTQLQALVTQRVTQLGIGRTGSDLAGIIGAEMATYAHGCSAMQVSGLLRNVAMILIGLGVEAPGGSNELTAILASAFVADGDALASDTEAEVLLASVY